MDKSPSALSQERCDTERLCGGCKECMRVCVGGIGDLSEERKNATLTGSTHGVALIV